MEKILGLSDKENKDCEEGILSCKDSHLVAGSDIREQQNNEERKILLRVVQIILKILSLSKMNLMLNWKL